VCAHTVRSACSVKQRQSRQQPHERYASGSQTSFWNMATDKMVVLTSLRACEKSRSPVINHSASAASAQARNFASVDQED